MVFDMLLVKVTYLYVTLKKRSKETYFLKSNKINNVLRIPVDIGGMEPEDPMARTVAW
jgi:hypothetical protein